MGVSSSVDTASLFPAGGSLTGKTVIVTVAETLFALPSLTLNVKLSVPLKLVFGVYVISVSAPIRLPWVGPVSIIYFKESPSESSPLSMTGIGLSSCAVICSLKAIGQSSTGVTLIETIAGRLLNLPSLTLNVKLSEPLKFV